MIDTTQVRNLFFVEGYRMMINDTPQVRNLIPGYPLGVNTTCNSLFIHRIHSLDLIPWGVF